MSGNQLAGEILKGHAGQYRSFSWPKGALTPEEEERCLSGILPGDRSRGNQTLRCVTCDSRRLLVSAYSAAQKSSSVDAVYQHAVFFENFQQQFGGNAAHEMAFFHFAGEGDFQSVASGGTQLSNDWPRRGAGLRETLCQLPLTPDQQADLACCCLSKGMTNDFGSLVILVPSSEDYAAYCRTVIERVLSCVPAGLWRYLSFATNPDETGKRSFAVLFAPEGTAVRAGERTAIRLEDGAWPVSSSLRPETAELIHTAAFNPEILRTVAGEVERDETLDRLTEERYVNFWRQYQLSRKPMDCTALRQYCGQLKQHLSQRERSRLEEEIRGRLSAQGALERALGQDEDLLRAAGPEELDHGLSAYGEIFRILGRGLDKAFSAELLNRITSAGPRTLEQLTEDAARLDRCRNAGEQGVLDRAAVRERREVLRRDIEAANRVRQEEFERAIPCGWDWRQLREQVDSLNCCQEGVRHSCLNKLAGLAMARLKDGTLSEEKTREFYANIRGLIDSAPEQMELERWYQSWQQQLEARRKMLESMTSYRAYLQLEKPDEECLHRLWDWFDENGYQNAGVWDLLQAAELKWGEAWPRLLERLDGLLRTMKKERRLGIWLAPGKSRANLHSELLACRMIEQQIGGIELRVWNQVSEKNKAPRTVRVDKILKMLRPMLLKEKQSGGVSPDQDEFPPKGTAASAADTEDDDILRDMMDEGGGEQPRESKGRKPKKLRPVFIALVASAALLLLAIGMALGLFLASAVNQPQPSETPAIVQSGEPSAVPSPSESEEQVQPSRTEGTIPSSSQDGGRVTPNQPEPSGQQGENGGTEVTPTRPSLPADSGGKE